MPEIRRLIEGCSSSDDLAGFRNRAHILIGFAAALRRSELVGHDAAEVGITDGSQANICPVQALHAWLRAAEAAVGTRRLHPAAVRQIPTRRAAAAGIKGTLLEPVAPHGMRAGFITTAYRNGVPDVEIMGHTRHRNPDHHAAAMCGAPRSEQPALPANSTFDNGTHQLPDWCPIAAQSPSLAQWRHALRLLCHT
jgi:integrase